MCTCKDIEVGSYDNQVELPRPDHMKVRTEGSANQHAICVDACLKDEILDLWSKGIRTTGCCCGHNKVPGYIGVIDQDIPLMLAMGYEVQPNEMYSERKDSFKPNS